MRITFRFHYWRNCTLRRGGIRFGLYQGLRQMCSERRSELTVKCVVNGVFLAVLFAKVVFRGILRVVSKLTAEMPMRYACRTHVAYVIGQLRQMTHGGVFSRRHPVPPGCLPFFYRRISIRIMRQLQNSPGHSRRSGDDGRIASGLRTKVRAPDALCPRRQPIRDCLRLLLQFPQ